MADWKVTVPISLPLNTIMAIHNGEGIEAALSELAASGLEGHNVVQDVARAVIDTVNGSAYRITSNGKTTMPPATFSSSPSTTDRECEAYDPLSTPKGSIISQQTPRQEDVVGYGEPCPPKKINISIRSTFNKDQHFRVGLYATIESLFNLYIDQQTVSGNFSGLRFGDLSWNAGCFDMDTLIKEDSTSVKDFLFSYADDTGLDFKKLIFVVNGGWELGQADYTSTLRDCGIKKGDMITVRPQEEKPKYINIFVQDSSGRCQILTTREDAQISTLRSQRASVKAHTFMSIELFLYRNQDLQRLHTPQNHRTFSRQADFFQALMSRQLLARAGTIPLALVQGGGANGPEAENKTLTAQRWVKKIRWNKKSYQISS
ncbi:hypothetical protein KC367_g7107 [Hortaea werneckii]|nr:hypothetical protein KC367_g7107 [Hortaea werneckii]